MDKIFHLKENGTTVRTEVIAGITTFMTMAYIIALNPLRVLKPAEERALPRPLRLSCSCSAFSRRHRTCDRPGPHQLHASQSIYRQIQGSIHTDIHPVSDLPHQVLRCGLI